MGFGKRFQIVAALLAWGVLALVLIVPQSLATQEDAGIQTGFFNGHLSLGYRAVSTQDNPVRAKEYSLLRSSATADLEMRGWKDQVGLYLDTTYDNESDYLAEADLNYKGLLRLQLISESLFHNLEHLPYDEQTRPDTSSVVIEDTDPGDSYHVEVEQSGVRMRGKLPKMPAHLNLGYWRLERSGKEQLRFVDEGGGTSCSSCHMQSRSRSLEQVTEEVSASVDAHLGYVDAIFEQLYREYRDREPIPRDEFGAHAYRIADNYQHDQEPDSRLLKSTLKLHTSLSGGVVGAASFSLGKRENQSELVDVEPVRSETDFKKAAGDLTLIPSPTWTLNFRYRLLDLDNSNTNRINAKGLIAYEDPATSKNPIDVRDNVDLTRASYRAAVSYRPNSKATLKGEFQRKEIHRGNTGAPDPDTDLGGVPVVIDPVWELPEDENINRYRVSFYGRPLGDSKLRLNTWYQYRTSSDPAYGTSAEQSHQGFLGMRWTPSMYWGAMANLSVKRDENEDHRLFFANEVDGQFSHFDLDRENENENLSAGFWLRPHERVMLSFNYGFLRTRILQDLLFGTEPNTSIPQEDFAVENENVKYSQKVHTASVTLNWQILENLRSHVVGTYIDSFAKFSPDFPSRFLEYEDDNGDPVSFIVSSDGLSELSRLDIRQTGVRIGMNWSPTSHWTCSAHYSFDDYEDRDNNVFDGSAQTYMASVTRSW